MHGSTPRASFKDTATESNTALLATSHLPEVLAGNRRICKQNGVDGGPMRLRRLQHFVTQQIVKLLTKHNLTQRSGKPYVYSCPKGFLQHPNEWLSGKGLYISGWPVGLPRGSISIWPTHLIFALAAMFINETITLKPIPSSSKNVLRGMSPTRGTVPEIDKSGTEDAPLVLSSEAPSEPKANGRENTADVDSDRDAEGSSESEPEHTPSAEYIAVSGNRRNRVELPIPLPTYPIPFHNDRQTVTNIVPSSLPSPQISSDTSKYFSCVPNTRTAFVKSSETKIDFTKPHSIELLASADLLLSASRKRGIDYGMAYQAIPSNVGLDWVPPISATREMKRARKK